MGITVVEVAVHTLKSSSDGTLELMLITKIHSLTPCITVDRQNTTLKFGFPLSCFEHFIFYNRRSQAHSL